jgi:gluconolactonase
MGGKSEVVATGCDGEPFQFPNDLCFGPDGALYLTDSGVFIDEFAPNNKIRPDYLSVPYDGRVYRVHISTGKVEKLDTGIKFTNGIAFGPDQRLYINETLTGNIYCYEDQPNLVAARRVLFGNVIRPDALPGWKGPDGMAFSADGKLYVAVFGQRDVTVLGSASKRPPRSVTRP